MLLRAALEHQVDLSSSFMVGDRWKDVECGRSAGCTTLFVDCGYAERLRSLPDFTVSNLLEAARLILLTNHSRI
jgi:D-glycero-D-manno-heptose 1,7-bisphosphate phosphatase